MQTQADMAQYDREQQATGQAISSGLTGMAGAANFSQAMNFYGKQGMSGGGAAGDAVGAAGGGNPNVGFQSIYGGGGLPGLSKLNLDFSPSIFFPTDK
jgi:hypothetical protein